MYSREYFAMANAPITRPEASNRQCCVRWCDHAAACFSRRPSRLSRLICSSGPQCGLRLRLPPGVPLPAIAPFSYSSHHAVSSPATTRRSPSRLILMGVAGLTCVLRFNLAVDAETDHCPATVRLPTTALGHREVIRPSPHSIAGGVEERDVRAAPTTTVYHFRLSQMATWHCAAQLTQ